MTPEDKRKREDEVERGERAEAILTDPLTIAALEAAKAKAYEMFALADNPQEAMRARDYLGAADLFIKDMKTHIGTGKMARRQLADYLDAISRKVARGSSFRSAA